MFVNLLLALLAGSLLAASFPLNTPLVPLPFALDLGLPFAAIPRLPLHGDYLHLAWLAWFAPLPLLVLARRAGSRAAFGWGYCAGVVWLLLSWCWLGSFGAVPVVLLALFFALPLGLFTWLAHWLLGCGRPDWILWGLPALWTALEYLRTFGFWAFPWNLLGYTQVRNVYLLQIAELGGVFAMSFVVMLACTALFLLWCPLETRAARRGRPLTDRGDWQGSASASPDYYYAAARRLRLGSALCGLAVVLLAHAYGALRLWQLDAALAAHPPRKLKLALVQGGVNTREAWSQALYVRSMQAYADPTRDVLGAWAAEHPAQPLPPPRDLSLELVGPPPPDGWPVVHPRHTATPLDPACLVVWPESSVPRRIDAPLNSALPGELHGLLNGRENAGLLFGAMGSPHTPQRLENGAVLLTSPGTQLDWVYSKVRPVPFGELLPFRGAIRFLEYPWSSQDVSEGRSVEPFEYAGIRLGVQICFDNAWSFVSRREALAGAGALLVITNNSWYDLPSGVRQHCDMDIVRAVETRRPLGRASTTGWSQLVLPSGRIAASSPQLNAPAVVEEWVPLMRGQSAYTVAGDVFAQLCLLLGVLLALRVVLPGRGEGWL